MNRGDEHDGKEAGAEDGLVNWDKVGQNTGAGKNKVRATLIRANAPTL